MLVEAKRSGMDDDEIAVQYDPPLSSDELTTADARSVRAARPPLPSVSPSSHPAPSCFSRYACTSSSHTIAVAICEYLETDTKVSLEYIAKAIDKLEAWEDLH